MKYADLGLSHFASIQRVLIDDIAGDVYNIFVVYSLDCIITQAKLVWTAATNIVYSYVSKNGNLLGITCPMMTSV